MHGGTRCFVAPSSPWQHHLTLHHRLPPFPGGVSAGRVPSPIQIANHLGDMTKADLFRDVMTLTKTNWNSAKAEGLLPVNLWFSSLAGDVRPTENRNRSRVRFSAEANWC